MRAQPGIKIEIGGKSKGAEGQRKLRLWYRRGGTQQTQGVAEKRGRGRAVRSEGSQMTKQRGRIVGDEATNKGVVKWGVVAANGVVGPASTELCSSVFLRWCVSADLCWNFLVILGVDSPNVSPPEEEVRQTARVRDRNQRDEREEKETKQKRRRRRKEEARC